ncbi:MAG: RNA ligase family protein [Cyanobacteriota bacterium]|nr:RNA ligase family protein [Cyanobacteriota bacterium]
MRAFNSDTARQRLQAAEDYVISRKIDGEFTCLLFSQGVCLTLNPGGTVRVGAPFHQEAAERLAAAGVKEAFLGGELYVRRNDGQRPRVHDVTRVTRKPAIAAEVASLCFTVFDIYRLDGDDYAARDGEALKQAERLFEKGERERVHVVGNTTGERDGVFAQYRKWVEKEGAEGVVVRAALRRACSRSSHAIAWIWRLWPFPKASTIERACFTAFCWPCPSMKTASSWWAGWGAVSRRSSGLPSCSSSARESWRATMWK